MIFESTPIGGAAVVVPEPYRDERGAFARWLCLEEFAAHGLEAGIRQVNASSNGRAGTLRGLHYQLAPHQEIKMVRCVRGALWDVALDLRTTSPTFGQWHGVELTPENGRLFYIPRGCAHGFVTLVDETEVLYFMSDPYVPSHQRGVRWDDPRFHIAWPRRPLVISEKDRQLPDYKAPGE